TSRNVSRLLTYWRQQEQQEREGLLTSAEHGPEGPAAPTASDSRRGMTPREAVGLLFRPVDDLTLEQQAARVEVCQLDPEIAQVDRLCTRFRQLLRDHDVEGLGTWLAAADRSGIEEVSSFAAKLRKDLAAVEAAVTSPWSQGQVEGQVNRLKLVKRSMYGRAKFDLLRQRVLYHAAVA